jgi:hypothetical protein
MKTLVVVAASLLLALSTPSFAAGKKSGFSSTSTQGAGGHTNTNANPSNEGQTTITGPRGQVKQGKTANTTVDLPGNGR